MRSDKRDLEKKLKEKITILPDLTPQSAFFGLVGENNMINHIHLIFKMEIYKMRSQKTCNVNIIINKIKEIRAIEQSITNFNEKAKAKNTVKWAILAGIL